MSIAWVHVLMRIWYFCHFNWDFFGGENLFLGFLSCYYHRLLQMHFSRILTYSKWLLSQSVCNTSKLLQIPTTMNYHSVQVFKITSHVSRTWFETQRMAWYNMPAVQVNIRSDRDRAWLPVKISSTNALFFSLKRKTFLTSNRFSLIFIENSRLGLHLNV